LENLFNKIICQDNLFLAWKEFKKGKTKKKDVLEFSKNYQNNLHNLHAELFTKTYKHSKYTSFYVKDPKLRHIHKAIVRDRVLHHAVFRVLYPIFDKSFIFDSYSCRLNKGTHRAVNRLQEFARKISQNNRKNCFVLKCDLKKYFNSINRDILIRLIRKKITDKNVIWLVRKIIKSFDSGLPLGNITSQLFANIYLHELDKFIKHRLKIKYYIRYCDDFIILDRNKAHLEGLIFKIGEFLEDELRISFHSEKIVIRKYRQGIDFLGYVCFSHFRTVRTKTKNRMFRKIKIKRLELRDCIITEKCFNQTMQSYLGVLKHCNSYKIKNDLLYLRRGFL